MRPSRNLLLVMFFLGLVILEIAHGASRIESLRARRAEELLAAIELRHRELADGLRPQLESPRQHTDYLARLASTRELVRQAGDAGASEAFGARFLPFLVSFPEVDRVRVLDAFSRELFRCQRNGDSVANLPAAHLRDSHDPVVRNLTSGLPPGTVGISLPVVDEERVESPASERQVLHYVAHLRPGFLVLTVYASPLLNLVRRFDALDGGSTFLVDDHGAVLAAPRREQELGGAHAVDLSRELPRLWARTDEPQGRFHEGDATVLVAQVSTVPRWHLVTRVPDRALAAVASRGIATEYAWIIAGMLAITGVLALAMLFFMRLSRRELALREAQRYQARAREMERQLAIAERLSSLGQLTAGVAHEINNPLEGIGNYLALLEREDLPAARRQRFLEQVRHGFERIRDLVRDLTTFARPETEPRAAELGAVIRRAVELVRYSGELRGADIQTTGLDVPLEVEGDAGRLEQVFINLLLNAGHAVDGSGRIEIAARVADMVEVSIIDSGPGIPEEILDRIFDPFFSTKHTTGLGLAISHGIVRVHGGTLTADNPPGGGARFRLRLPVSPRESVETPMGASS